MDRNTALTVFGALDKVRSEDGITESPTRPPTFDLRLDAGSGIPDDRFERTYRVRVTPSKAWGDPTPDEWRYVLDLADEHGFEVSMQNAGWDLS